MDCDWKIIKQKPEPPDLYTIKLRFCPKEWSPIPPPQRKTHHHQSSHHKPSKIITAKGPRLIFLAAAAARGVATIAPSWGHGGDGLIRRVGDVIVVGVRVITLGCHLLLQILDAAEASPLAPWRVPVGWDSKICSKGWFTNGVFIRKSMGGFYVRHFAKLKLVRSNHPFGGWNQFDLVAEEEEKGETCPRNPKIIRLPVYIIILSLWRIHVQLGSANSRGKELAPSHFKLEIARVLHFLFQAGIFLAAHVSLVGWVYIYTRIVCVFINTF